MKRAVGALAATIAGVALLVNYKPTPADSTAQVQPTPAATTRPSVTRSSGEDEEEHERAPLPTAPSRTSAPRVAAGPNGSKVVTGPAVNTIFGEVQVSVTVTGSRIVDVQALQLPYDRSRSAYISQVVGPMLRSEAIQAQNANVDVISGATYTSIAYGRSLSSALQQAQSN
jgi:uncharacterized protein with FMN-binding domain